MTASEQIIQVLDELCKRFGIVVDWSKDNIIPYLEELTRKIVLYELWTSVVWILLSVIAGYFTVRLIKWSFDGLKTHDWTCNDRYIIGSIVSAFFVITIIIVFVINLMDVVTCLTFPEKVLYDFVSGLLNS